MNKECPENTNQKKAKWLIYYQTSNAKKQRKLSGI